ncbi:hypothetical protein H4582DRAFT_873258 [Lactarius indigo]|nr:hypothetical protein H4582DRAFT_873258 [Lactarius indigo]
MDRPGLDEDGKPCVTLQEMERLLDRLVALPTVVLKTGAQVMLIKNLEQGHLVNGSTGVVIGFGTHHEAAFRDICQTLRHTVAPGQVHEWPPTFLYPRRIYCQRRFREGGSNPDTSTAHSRLGTQRAQVPGPDTAAGQSRPSQHF